MPRQKLSALRLVSEEPSRSGVAALASRRLKTMQKPEYSSCRLRRERKIGSSSPSWSSFVRACGSTWERSRAMYRCNCSRVSAEHQMGFRTLCSPCCGPEAVTSMPIFGFCARRSPPAVRPRTSETRAPLSSRNAQDDRLTRWGVVDHVPHPGQNCQPRRLRVACHRWLHRLPPHWKNPTGWWACSVRDTETDTCVVRCSSVAIHLRCSDRQATKDLGVHGFS